MRHHIVLLGVLILQPGISLKVRTPRVAVIGGGIGGASASHFLTELFNKSVQIDLYEAGAIGGRLKTIKIRQDVIEADGSLIHPKNMYMQRFVKLLGLEKITINDRDFGVWDGNKFVFLSDSWTTEKMLSISYGDGPSNLQSYGNNILKDVQKIYDLQDAGKSFDSVATLLSAMNKNFPMQLKRSTRHYLQSKNFTKQLIDKLAQGFTVGNYGQEVDIHSFVGLLSVTVLNNDSWSVKGGNKKIPELLINRNKNLNVIHSRVTKIRNLENIHDSSQYEVTHINRDSEDSITSNYDIVIIAVPLTSDQAFQIKFVKFPHELVFSGNYQTTYATFLKADLNLDHFGMQLDRIFNCNSNQRKISFIGKANPVDSLIKENSTVWKIFSREYTDIRLIDNMFLNISDIWQIVWKAYPRYSSSLYFDKFKLHDALYHVNVIEWAASTMEMSAIAARNVAILAHKNFLQKSYDFVSNNKTAESSTEYMRKEF